VLAQYSHPCADALLPLVAHHAVDLSLCGRSFVSDDTPSSKASPGMQILTRSVRDASATVSMTVALPVAALTFVASLPELISQENVELVLGIPQRQYLEILRLPECTVEVIVCGKLRLVRRVEFVAWLCAPRATCSEQQTNDASDGSNASLDALAEEYNLQRPPPPSGRRRTRRT
jgi:hypothetical protein